jgi:hypothetical protein
VGVVKGREGKGRGREEAGERGEASERGELVVVVVAAGEGGRERRQASAIR